MYQYYSLCVPTLGRVVQDPTPYALVPGTRGGHESEPEVSRGGWTIPVGRGSVPRTSKAKVLVG